MNFEYIKFAVAVGASAITAYSAIRVDLVELKVNAHHIELRVEKLENKLDK